MPDTRDILVVGGYGAVGHRIAGRLASVYPGRVVVAGRSPARPSQLGIAPSYGVRLRRIDVNDPASVHAALEGVGTVVSCVQQRELHLLRAAIARGLAYTDICPRLPFWRGVEAMDADARRTGARILLGAGLSPGISNVMARQLAENCNTVDRVETAILLSVGDEFGPDSMSCILDATAGSYVLWENGVEREATPFSEPQPVLFPAPLGRRTTYLFPFSDAVYYPKTLRARSSQARLALDPAWVGTLAAVLFTARRRVRRVGIFEPRPRIMQGLRHLYAGHDHFGLVVRLCDAGVENRMSIVGRRQADVTAASAAVLCRALCDSEVSEAGLWFPEQVIDPAPFFERLAGDGFRVTLEHGIASLATAGASSGSTVGEVRGGRTAAGGIHG